MIINLWDASRGQLPASVPGPLTIGGGTPAQVNNSAFVVPGFATFTATRDPLTTDDITQGVVPGHCWYNAVALRDWECISNAAGAAVWVFDGAYYSGGGTNPPSEQTQAGSSTASIAAEGNIYREVLPPLSGRPGQATGSGTWTVVGVYTLPASFFDGAVLPGGTQVGNRGVNVTAMGSLGANGNTKRVAIIVSPPVTTLGGTFSVGQGTVLADTGAITVSGGGWSLQTEVYKYGAAGSNTQVSFHQQAQAGSTVSALLAPQALTLTENANITFAACVANTTLATDSIYNFMSFNAMN